MNKEGVYARQTHIARPGVRLLNRTSRTVSPTDAGIRFGGSIADDFVAVKLAEPWLRSGELRVVLAEWAPMEPAMYLYYPGNRTVPSGLRELIDVFREGMAT